MSILQHFGLAPVVSLASSSGLIVRVMSAPQL
jgi:hypothetical protein